MVRGGLRIADHGALSENLGIAWLAKFLKAVLALMTVEDQCIGQTTAGLQSLESMFVLAPKFRELIDLLE